MHTSRLCTQYCNTSPNSVVGEINVWNEIKLNFGQQKNIVTLVLVFVF